MPISRRLAKTVRRIVFEMMIEAIRMKTAMIAMPILPRTELSCSSLATTSCAVVERTDAGHFGDVCGHGGDLFRRSHANAQLIRQRILREQRRVDLAAHPPAQLLKALLLWNELYRAHAMVFCDRGAQRGRLRRR